MITVESLIGPWAAFAAVMVVAIAIGLSLARERRGPDSRVTTLSDSHPWLTSGAVAITAAAVLLFILRLGVLT